MGVVSHAHRRHAAQVSALSVPPRRVAHVGGECTPKRGLNVVTPPTTSGPVAGGSFTPSETVLNLLSRMPAPQPPLVPPCTIGAFLEEIRVAATATDGWSQLSGYDAPTRARSRSHRTRAWEEAAASTPAGAAAFVRLAHCEKLELSRRARCRQLLEPLRNSRARSSAHSRRLLAASFCGPQFLSCVLPFCTKRCHRSPVPGSRKVM